MHSQNKVHIQFQQELLSQPTSTTNNLISYYVIIVCKLRNHTFLMNAYCFLRDYIHVCTYARMPEFW